MGRPLTLSGLLAVLAIAGSAMGQTAGPQAKMEGKIDRFTLSPSGTPDGFLFDSGLEVHFHRYLGKQLSTTLKRGELVQVEGTHLVAQHVVLASSVTDLVNGQHLDDKGEMGVQAQNTGTGTTASADGLVKTLLHGSQGQVDGVILDNDTMVRLPSGVPAILPNLMAVGAHLAVSGQQLDTENGRVIRIESMGPSSSELTALQQSSVGQQ